MENIQPNHHGNHKNTAKTYQLKINKEINKRINKKSIKKINPFNLTLFEKINSNQCKKSIQKSIENIDCIQYPILRVCFLDEH